MTWAKFTNLVVAICAAGALMVSVVNTFKINEVHLTFNSRMDAYIELVRQSANARGRLEQQELDK